MDFLDPRCRFCGYLGHAIRNLFLGLLAVGGAGAVHGANVPHFQRPVFFERNDGQLDSSVLYTGRGLGYTVYLTRSGATMVAPAPHQASTAGQRDGGYFRLTFTGTNANASVTGVGELPGRSNYFGGSDPKSWHTNISQFAKVRYTNLYPGIDVVFYVRNGQLEYDILGAPKANLRAVHFSVEGVTAASTKEGDLVVPFGSGIFTLKRPRVYARNLYAKPASANYLVRGKSVSFQLGPYDHNQPLVVDPALIFSTDLNSNCLLSSQPGDNCADTVSDIAVDASGVYVAGSTSGPSFPSSNPTPQTTGGNSQNFQTFVIKLDPTASTLIYAAYLSSSKGFAIAVDVAGAAYISGTAQVPAPSGAMSFPLTTGVFSGTVPAGLTSTSVPFAAKLSATGSAVQYSTLLQQPNTGPNPPAYVQVITPSKIAVDSQGALYVTGTAQLNNMLSAPAQWSPVPVIPGAFQQTPGTLFAMKLNPGASGLAYGTYIDGTNANNHGTGNGLAANGIALDSSGDAFITGVSGGGFPITPGSYQSSDLASSGANAFIFALNPAGSAPLYSTYFGGAGQTTAYGIAVDATGEATITGKSADTIPITPGAFCPLPTPPPGVQPGFIAKLNASGSALVYSTSLCGYMAEGDSVALDSAGDAYVLGQTSYPGAFPLQSPIQNYYSNPVTNPTSLPQAVVALKVNPTGALLWSTFLGSGPGCPTCRIQVDSSGSAFALIDSIGNFPTTANTVGLRSPGTSVNQGPQQLIKIAASLGSPVPGVIPLSVSFAPQNLGVASAAADVQVGNFGDAQITPSASITGDFSETDNCGTGVPAGSKCDVNVVFTPTAAGTRTGVLTLSFGGGIPSQTVSLAGVSTAPAAGLAPTSLSFGNQATGTTSATQQVTVTNTGTGPLLIVSIQASSEFAATSTCGGSIAPSATCTIQVSFTPTASGSQTGTLAINDNVPGSPQTVPLTGNQPANFVLAIGSGGAASPSVTVVLGQSATYNLSIQGVNGFSGSVALACTGAPANSTCSVQPNP
ncbi:MAG TPA: choice-of-anchor D domain-containing protein, partial [Candidatus Acidoferrales bacterium]|nr:choice-of-anchor D domain-containing protein [Candidatus Acidoferrales bacterium]